MSTGSTTLLLVFYALVAPLSPLVLTVDASPYDDAIDITTKEYKAWRSWKALEGCMNPSGKRLIGFQWG